jgi:hypothetical protein
MYVAYQTYKYIDILSSTTPILTSLTAVDWPRMINICKDKTIRTIGSFQDNGTFFVAKPEGAISGHVGTTIGCRTFGGCVSYSPANICKTFITSIMINVQRSSIFGNTPDLTQKTIIDKINYKLNVSDNTIIQKGCPTSSNCIYLVHSKYYKI